MVGNIAELDTYRSWGIEQVRHWPLGFFADDYDPALTGDKILNGNRDVDIALLCERQTNYRAKRLDKFTAAFPDAAYYGKGWPRGFLPCEQKVSLYQKTKIGPNFHNSTGPVNFRTFILPANGVMQICDNKSHLGRLFQLGKEVVGFDTVEEAIELCHYYLEHDDERRQIAAAGWERAIRDYNEEATFRLLEEYVTELLPHTESKPQKPIKLYLKRHRRYTILQKSLCHVQKTIGRGLRLLKRVIRILRKRRSAESQLKQI